MQGLERRDLLERLDEGSHSQRDDLHRRQRTDSERGRQHLYGFRDDLHLRDAFDQELEHLPGGEQRHLHNERVEPGAADARLRRQRQRLGRIPAKPGVRRQRRSNSSAPTRKGRSMRRMRSIWERRRSSTARSTDRPSCSARARTLTSLASRLSRPVCRGILRSTLDLQPPQLYAGSENSPTSLPPAFGKVKPRGSLRTSRHHALRR